MFVLLSAMAALTLSPPDEPLLGQLRRAIWSDLHLNAWIGNGNWTASLWYQAGQADAKTADLHIQDLTCASESEVYRCAFTLLRDGGVRKALDETAPDRLTCTAIFVRDPDSDEWKVKHHPPRNGTGHSQTDMRCEAAPSA